MSTERKLDLSKHVRTRDGHEVVIYTTQGLTLNQPVVGGRKDSEGFWWTYTWTSKGTWHHDGEVSEYDLVNVPAKHAMWLNVYREDGEIYACVFDSKELAEHRSDKHSVATIQVAFTEGEGLG